MMKQFVWRFFFLFLVIFGGTAVYNYKYDTTGLFNTDFSMRRIEPNQHFVKVRYVLDNPKKYNAFCFGSSRVGAIDLTQIHNGLRYYNMTYSMGLPKEWLEDIRLFIKHHVDVRQIILGIDEFSYMYDPKPHEKQLLRFPYRDSKLIERYMSVLLRMPSKCPIINDENSAHFDIYGAGSTSMLEVDEKIEQDITAHILGTKFPQIVSTYKANGDCVNETIATLREIKSLADENDIKLIVFINPIHQTRYLMMTDLERLTKFKEKLVDVTGFYDFSGLNDITTNNYNYYETSHYRHLVGDMIVRRIYYPELGKSFGAFVSKSNIEEHLDFLKQQAINKYRAMIWHCDGN